MLDLLLSLVLRHVKKTVRPPPPVPACLPPASGHDSPSVADPACGCCCCRHEWLVAWSRLLLQVEEIFGAALMRLCQQDPAVQRLLEKTQLTGKSHWDTRLSLKQFKVRR